MLEVAGGIALFLVCLFLLDAAIVGVKLIYTWLNDLSFRSARLRFQKRSRQQEP